VDAHLSAPAAAESIATADELHLHDLIVPTAPAPHDGRHSAHGGTR